MLFLASCDSGGSTGPKPVDQVQVSPPTATIEVGETTQLSATARDANGSVLTDRSISWSSSGQAVATVSSAGVVTGVAAGLATITATSEGVSASASVTVTPASVQAVEVSPSQLNLIIGETDQLSATTKDGSGNVLTGRTVTWSSSDDGVASVASDGTVTAVSEGTATITATSEGKSGTATVNVSPVPVETVEVTPAELAIAIGNQGQLTATTKDADGNVLTDRSIDWSSSDESVATVDSDGLVTGVAVGEATITATSEGKSGTADVDVTPAAFNPQGDTEISGTVSFESVDIPAGVTVTMTDDLEMTVTGDVTIGGTLTGECVSVDIDGGGAVTINGDVDNDCAATPATDAKPPLTIIGNGPFTVDGSSMASSGEITLMNDPTITGPPVPVPGQSPAQAPANLNGPFPCTLMNYTVVIGVKRALSGLPGSPDGQDGDRGAGFIFACNGDLSLKGNVQIETQEGGAGGKGTDQRDDGADAFGGDGGNGGSIYLWAFGDFSATMEVQGTEIKNHLFSGRGGDGGDAEGTGLENDAVDPAPSGTAEGGWGGAAGVIDIQAVGDFSVEPNVLYAGVGQSNPSGGAAGGGAGGDGIGVGARGKDASERTPNRMAQVGGEGVGRGGVGGDAPGFHTIILGDDNGLENVVVEAGDAGPGGIGDATGGKGGDGNEEFKDGAKGGDINAEGGDGGEAGSSRGGDGGLAVFRLGWGGNGWSDCQMGAFEPGGNGGDGGDSTGGGGSGGPGLNPGADGSHDTEDVSNGGDGGDGAGPGSGGSAGGGDNITDPYEGAPGQGAGAAGPEQVELGFGSFLDGLPGMGCQAGGTFQATIDVAADPAGHAFYIQMPSGLVLYVNATVISETEGTIDMVSVFPWVEAHGTWNPSTGEINALGQGTVAGYPNTYVFFTGTLIGGTLTGIYQMGWAEHEPGEGGLPTGTPIWYQVDGTRTGPLPAGGG